MSGYPVIVDGARVSALVVGGGPVALRKVRGLVDGGVRVTVVTLSAVPELHALVESSSRIKLTIAPYDERHIDDATIVIAATDDSSVNARVAADAMRLHRLVNVADAPNTGTFSTPAAHRAGDLTIAVSAGRLPAAASAIRDSIAGRFDDRYAVAIAGLRDLRDRLLANGNRDQWKSISMEVLGDDFCADVERGSLAAKVGAWR